MTKINLQMDDPAEFARWLTAYAGQVPGTWAERAAQLLSMAYQIEQKLRGAEHADRMNLEYRRDVAAAVLEAMDVDQYLIDAVRTARPADTDVTPLESKAFVEGFDAACDEIIRDLIRLLEEAITGERRDAYEKAIAAVEHQKAWA